MPFSHLKLHPSLLKAIKELGFVRPTPIQAEAIPPALAGPRPDRLRPDRQRQDRRVPAADPAPPDRRPRRTRPGRSCSPRRASWRRRFSTTSTTFAVHTPVTGAAVFGGVGMGPQEHAFRSGVDVIIATPGRLLDHMRSRYAQLGPASSTWCSTRPTACSTWASCRRSGAILAQLPARRQTLFFSATMPAPIAALAGEMLRNPVSIQLQRQAAPAAGITQAVYPVPQELKSSLLVHLLRNRTMTQALVFTRTKHRANRLADTLVQAGINVRAHSRQPVAGAAHRGARRLQERHATRSSSRPTSPRAASTSMQLGHVVNFDVPLVPDDYIHRVGRTGRAEATGEAFTFVAPEEEADLRDIERAIGRRLPRVTVPDFDYARTPEDAARDSARPAHRGDPRAQARRAGPGRDQCGTAWRRDPPAEAAGGSRPPQPQPAGGRPAHSTGGRPPQPGGGRPSHPARRARTAINRRSHRPGGGGRGRADAEAGGPVHRILAAAALDGAGTPWRVEGWNALMLQFAYEEDRFSRTRHDGHRHERTAARCRFPAHGVESEPGERRAASSRGRDDRRHTA